MKIDIHNFESIIDPDVLNRGVQICQNENIQTLEKIGDNDYSAIVAGSEIYLTNISFDRAGALLTHTCNCPYQSGPVCKHKAAVLLTIRKHLKNNLPFEQGKLNQLNTTLDKQDKAALTQIIMELAKHNMSSRNSLLKLLDINNHSPGK